MSKSEINGNILMAGTVILTIGVWIEWSFGAALVTLGVTWIIAACLADGGEE